MIVVSVIASAPVFLLALILAVAAAHRLHHDLETLPGGF